MPIFVRLHHVNGTIDGRTHVAGEGDHVMSHHVVHLMKRDGGLSKYDLQAGHEPIVVEPEHREYFETLRDHGEGSPLACEVYEADKARPVPPAPSRKTGALTTEDLRLFGERAEATLKEAREVAQATQSAVDDRLGRMEAMLQQLVAGKAEPAAKKAAKPGTVPASFEATPPAAAAPAAKAGAGEPDGEEAEPTQPQAPESDAKVMARTAHATATKAGFRDKRPEKAQP